MVHNMSGLPDRDLNFILNRIEFFEQEITRYRDLEWKSTSFHAAFYVALIFLLFDKEHSVILRSANVSLTIAVVIYAILACVQLVYIHYRLNFCRNEKFDLLTRIGEQSSLKITTFGGLYEGIGFIFILGFLLSLVSLATTVVLMLWS